ncbi:MAG: hypothetical protein ACFE96_06150 [Candidatus Hermodarchaeota archaeon]
MTNEKRKRIFEYIVDHPGTYFNRIVTELNYSNHVVVWHLNMLIKFDFIRKEVLEKHEIYFDATKELDEIISRYFTSKEKSRDIIDYLKNDDIGVTKTNLSHDLSMHMDTLTKYLKLLEKYDMIVKKKIDNRNLYFLKQK